VKSKPGGQKNSLVRRHKWLFSGGIAAICVLAAGLWIVNSSEPVAAEAPEAENILNVQSAMPFQILIPAYLPREFNRAGAEIKVDEMGPGGEPMVQLAYRTPQGATLFVREWVPVNPDMEILAASHPIQTKWGKGWLLTQGKSLVALWVDIGPLRTSIYTHNTDVLSREQILAIAESLGPASNRQVFTFMVDPPTIAALPPAPPVEVPTNVEGIQEITLVVTPGGYTPLRFAVKKDVPVRLIFRKLGEVGCGNELIFPADPDNPSSLALDDEHEKQVLEFTPRRTGQFQFHCAHLMYRGVLTVHE
jgi:hypothetical protein